MDDAGARKRKSNSALKKVFFVLALLPLAATVGLTVLFVLPGIKDPVSLLKFPRTRYVVISFVLFALWTGAVVLIVWLESNVMNWKSGGVIVLAGALNGAALLWLLVSLIQSASGFSANVGVVRLSDAAELSYIRNYPDGDFVLTGDIDAKGEEWKSVSKYRGSLHGNGHSIVNLTIGEHGFIKENLGELSSLTLSKVRYADFEPGRNFGTLVEVNRGKVRNCALSPAGDKTNPAAGVLVGCSYGTCINNTGICNDRCEEHTYKLESAAPAAFPFKRGTEQYRCEICGDSYTAAAVYGQPVKLILSVVLMLIAAAGVILRAVRHKYGAAALLGIAALILAAVVFSYITVGMNAGKGETWVDRRLAKEGQTEQPEEEEAGEDEDDPAPEWTALEEYKEHSEEAAETVYELEDNNGAGYATNVSLFSKAVGNLYSEMDVDYYSFTVTVKSKMQFQFSHQGDNIYGHWDACIYGTDGTTVLNEGYIAAGESSEFGVSDLEPGTYYLKIAKTSAANPLMFSFSDAQYTVAFIPSCIEHSDCTQYIYTRPLCTGKGEIANVCNVCGETVSMEEIEPEGHTWGEWGTIKEASLFHLGEQARFCSVCGARERKKITTYVWAIAFTVLAVVIMLRGAKFYAENERSGVVFRSKEIFWKGFGIVLALFLCAAAGGYALLRVPLGMSPVQVRLLLAGFCSINLLLITGALVTMYAGGGERYKAGLVVSAFSVLFLLLAGTLLLEDSVLTLAILFGVVTVLNLCLAVAAHSDGAHKWMAFAIVLTVVALGLTVSLGRRVKEQIGADPAGEAAQVYQVQAHWKL